MLPSVLPTETDHVPVLAGEVLAGLDPRPGQTVVDATFGAGGHAELLATRLRGDGKLIAIDRDPTVVPYFERVRRATGVKARLLPGEFSSVLRGLADNGVRADAILLDLGVSSMQLDRPERGFSYSHDAPLDMRMDQDAPLTAADLLNTYDKRALTRVLQEFGEERFASRIAGEIVRRRDRKPFETTAELVEVLYDVIPAPARRTGGHPGKRTFQALRTAVNGELDSLRSAIPSALAALRQHGRIVVMAYQSLEDKIVKGEFAAATASRTPAGLPMELPGHEPYFVLLTRGAEKAGDD